MNRKENKKRKLFLFIIIVVVIIIVLFIFLPKKDYTVTYSKNDYEIQESYNKENDAYAFVLTKEENTFYTVINHQYFHAKKIIEQITEYQTETEICLKIESNKARIEPLCMKNGIQVSYHLVSEEMKNKLELTTSNEEASVLKTYNNINVYNFANHNYYIWNYRGFYHINETTEENITLFDNDIYNPSLITQVDGILVIPDYSADYYFNKIFLLDMETGNVTTWNLDTSIYFDSSILGIYDQELYLIDKHEKIEWKLNIKKKTEEKVGTESKGGIIYDHGWTNVTMNRLIYQENNFQGTTMINYTILEDGLYKEYEDYRMKIKESAPTKIISNTMNNVYYLVGDNVYSFNNNEGEKLLLNYFEWNFNSDNVIFID